MRKWLLFTNGGGSSDPLNWASSEAALYSTDDLKTIKPSGAVSLDLIFDVCGNVETVTLKIRNRSHTKVISAIANAVEKSNQSIISVADKDGNRFISPFVYDVVIKTGTPILYYNKITDATAVEIIDIDTKTEKLMSMTLANVHSSDATVQVYLLDAGGILYYIIKDIVIPTGATLKLESDELDYDASVFNLYVKLGGTTPVDVIIR